jgi:hypothetical protein
MAVATAVARVVPQAEGGSRFYFWMAAVMAACAFIGFTPTFWAPMTRGAFTSPVVTIHGLVSSTWVLFVVLQAWLAGSGRIRRHRSVGLAGISLATLVAVFGVMAAMSQAQRAAGVGAREAGLAFMVVPISQVVLFAILVAWAIATTRRPDWHKRLLLVAMALVIDGAFGRLAVYYGVFHGHMPVPAGMPSPPPPVDMGYLVDPFLLAALGYDWRVRGRPHPAYLWGSGAVTLLRALRPAISRTAAWQAIAAWILSLAGA